MKFLDNLPDELRVRLIFIAILLVVVVTFATVNYLLKPEIPFVKPKPTIELVSISEVATENITIDEVQCVREVRTSIYPGVADVITSVNIDCDGTQ